MKDNVYEVINNAESSDELAFKYVQIYKQEVVTNFSKHEVLQFIDVSQKMLYEMASGEKRLFSLINATVSHEMRNPTNSMQAQIQEQKLINIKLKETIDTMKPNNYQKSKQNLQRIYKRQTGSTTVQMTAIKILNFLVNDMLDFAQLSAGKFRKNWSQFELVGSISEVIDIMDFKAKELGITLLKSFELFEQDKQQGQPLKIWINFDSQRLQQILLNLISNAVKFTPRGG